MAGCLMEKNLPLVSSPRVSDGKLMVNHASRVCSRHLDFPRFPPSSSCDVLSCRSTKAELWTSTQLLFALH